MPVAVVGGQERAAVTSRDHVAEPNISTWRRQTVGDPTSAFQFSRRAPFPAFNEALSVPSTTVTLLTAQKEVAVNTLPVQETTTARVICARPPNKQLP